MRILVYRTDRGMIARSLERDFAAHGEDVGHALESFKRSAIGMICLGKHYQANPFDHLAPVPKKIEERWRHAIPLKEKISISHPVSFTLQWDGDAEETGSAKENISALVAVE